MGGRRGKYLRWIALIAALGGVLASMWPAATYAFVTSWGCYFRYFILSGSPYDCAMNHLMPFERVSINEWGQVWSQLCWGAQAMVSDHTCASMFDELSAKRLNRGEISLNAALSGCADFIPSIHFMERNKSGCASKVWYEWKGGPVDVIKTCEPFRRDNDVPGTMVSSLRDCITSGVDRMVQLGYPMYAIRACSPFGLYNNYCLVRAAVRIADDDLNLALLTCNLTINRAQECRERIAPIAASHLGPNSTAALCGSNNKCLVRVAVAGAIIDFESSMRICTHKTNGSSCFYDAASYLRVTNRSLANTVCKRITDERMQRLCIN